MRRLQRQRALNVRQRLRYGLLRQAVHQIEVEIRKAGGVQLSDRAFSIGGAMDAPQALQLLGIKALRAKLNPGDAGAAIVGEAPALDRAGIGLERHLDVGGQFQLAAHRVEQPRQRCR